MTNHVDKMFQQDEKGIEAKAAEIAESCVIEEAELEELKAELTQRKAALDDNKRQLAELLQQAGLESIKLESGLSPKVMSKTKYYKTAGLLDEHLFSWLTGAGLGDIIKPCVNFQTMQGALKDFVAQGGELDENIINASTELTVRMNGKSKFLNNRSVK